MNDSTKECGLEDENTGETLSSIPLVGETVSWDDVKKAGALMDSLPVPSRSMDEIRISRRCYEALLEKKEA